MSVHVWLFAAAMVCCAPAPRATHTSTIAPPVASVAPVVEVLRIVDARLQVLARVPAFDADASGGRVFAFDPEVRTLRGFDLANGKELWSAPLGVAPSGRVRLYPAFGASKRVLVHVQNQLLLFDPDTGALASQTAGPWSQDKTSFSSEHGACTFSTECDLHFVDCDSARPYGPVLRIAITHLYSSLSKPHDNVCWGPRRVVGRGGNVTVAVTDGRELELPNTEKQPGPVTLGIEAGTGTIAWSTRALGCEHCVTSGVSPDGGTCWLADTDGKLDVFACATGKPAFQKKLAVAENAPALFTAWASGGLFVSGATEASLLDGKTGKALWTRALPANGLALPLATPLDLDRYSTWQARTVLLLDPASGKEAARFDLPAYTELLQSPDLGLRVKGSVAFDAKGQKRTFAEEPALFTLAREQTPRLLRAGDTTLAEVTTDLAIVAARHTAQGDELALFLWGPPGKPGQLVFARWPAP